MNTKYIAASTSSVGATPTLTGVAKCFMSSSASGEPIIAPPPKPMIAMPVAMPRRSGNHLISMETGEIYPSPRPMPPIRPEPSHSIHNWCARTPAAEITSPPHQHRAATTPALRGPACSTQPPQRAAEEPRNTKNKVYIQPRLEMRQSQLVVNSSVTRRMSGQARDCLIPSAFDNGSQNTEKP